MWPFVGSRRVYDLRVQKVYVLLACLDNIVYVLLVGSSHTSEIQKKYTFLRFRERSIRSLEITEFRHVRVERERERERERDFEFLIYTFFEVLSYSKYSDSVSQYIHQVERNYASDYVIFNSREREREREFRIRNTEIIGAYFTYIYY